MSLEDHGRVPIRSYRIVFRLERRIFQIDRYRLPFPYGVEVRALLYAPVVYLVLLVVSRLPLLRTVFGLLPTPVHWGLLPLGVVWAMLKLRIDGRPPHRVLAAAVRFAVSPRQLAGLRPCPRPGFAFAPVDRLFLRPDWRSPRYRPGVIDGPATVTLRYPAIIEVRQPWRQRLRGQRPRKQGEIAASRLVIREDAGRPMFIGKTLQIPPGGRVVFR
jgi:hypothetical protein